MNPLGVPSRMIIFMSEVYFDGMLYYGHHHNLSAIARHHVSQVSSVPESRDCMELCANITDAAQLDVDKPACPGLMFFHRNEPNCIIFTEKREDHIDSPLDFFIKTIDTMMKETVENPRKPAPKLESPGIRLLYGPLHGIYVFLAAGVLAHVSAKLFDLFRNHVLPAFHGPRPTPYTDQDIDAWQMLLMAIIVGIFHVPDEPFDPKDRTLITAFKDVFHAWLKIATWGAIYMALLIWHRVTSLFMACGRNLGEKGLPASSDREQQVTSQPESPNSPRERSREVVDEDVVLIDKQEVDRRTARWPERPVATRT